MFSSQFDFLSLISAKIRRISLVPHELAKFFTPRFRLKKPPVSKATASRLGIENNTLLRVRSLLPDSQEEALNYWKVNPLESVSGDTHGGGLFIYSGLVGRV